MRKEKLLWLVIILFALMNVACLAFILTERIHRPPHRVDQVIIEGLDLDDRQVEKFDRLKQMHHAEMLRLDSEMKQPFDEYFMLLTSNGNLNKKDSLEMLLSSLYKAKLNATYAHFADVKAICRPDQQKKMTEIVPFLMQVISAEKKDGPPRGR